MSDESNVPDWLKQLRPQEFGGPVSQPAQPEPPASASWAAQDQVAEQVVPAAGGTDGLDALREIASVEPPPEEPRRLDIPVINQLTPFQRFVLALMLFLNVSVLGCLFLMVTQKISFVR